MNTQRVNLNTCTTKKNATRSQVWDCFQTKRAAGLNPILLESAKGWSFVALPDETQPAWDESLSFLDEFYRGLECRDAGLSEEDEPPFIGGWLGYLSYDWGLEQQGLSSQHQARLPKMQWRYCSQVFAFYVVEEDGKDYLNSLSEDSWEGFYLGDLQAGISKDHYLQQLAKVHELLRAGESYQINFTYPLRAEFSGDPFLLYAKLFAANPSAMCFYMELEQGDVNNPLTIASNSPERLVSLKDGRLLVEPVKGTLPRSADPNELLEDEKSDAELSMIVDLMRNDLARVAKRGTVKVEAHQALMELKNVWHTYSRISAEFDADRYGISDLIRAVFPGGSVTGCPKRRSMRHIDALENFSRGAYCGSAGYVSLNGNVDFNIMIRTATLFSHSEQSNGRLEFPVGGGIVMDSDAELEYEETLHKSATLRSLTVESGQD